MDGQSNRFSQYKSREEQAEEINYFCCNIDSWTQDFKSNFEIIPGNNLTFTEYVQRKLLDRRNNQLSNIETTERSPNNMLRTSNVNDSKSLIESLQAEVDGDVRPDPQETLKRFIHEEQPELEKIESRQTILPNRQVDVNQEFILRGKKYAEELKNLGNIAFRLQDFSTAVNHYTEAIKYDPENAILYGNRAQAHLNLGQHIKAIADCDIALNFDPTYIKALYRRGHAKIENGDLDSGRTDLMLTIKLEPKNRDAITLLANVNSRLKPQSKGDGHVEPRVNSPLTQKPVPPSKTVLKKPLDKKQPPEVQQVFPKVILPILKPTRLHSKRPIMSVRVDFVGGDSDNNKGDSVQESSNTRPENTLPEDLEKTRKFCLGVPCPGKTAAQFLLDWSKLVDTPSIAALYLKQMKAEDFKVFEGVGTMEYVLLGEIIDVLAWEFLPRKWDPKEILIGIAAFVGRVELLLCFISDKEKAELKKLLSTQKDFIRDYYKETFLI